MMKKLDIDELEAAELVRGCNRARKLVDLAKQALDNVDQQLKAASQWLDKLEFEARYAEEVEE